MYMTLNADFYISTYLTYIFYWNQAFFILLKENSNPKQITGHKCHMCALSHSLATNRKTTERLFFTMASIHSPKLNHAMYMAIFIHTQQIKTSLYPNDCILSKTFNMFSYRQYQHLDKRLNLILWNAKNKNHTLYILICEILDSCFLVTQCKMSSAKINKVFWFQPGGKRLPKIKISTCFVWIMVLKPTKI